MFRAIPLLVLLNWPALPADGPLREASAPAIVGMIMPGFYNGYLFSTEPRHVLTLFAPDGHELFSLPFEGHGNGNVGIESVAIDGNRTLAVGWDDPPNSGIDICDLSGTRVRSIDTGWYVPAHLAFGGDHSLWALGWQRDATRPDRHDDHDYPIIRKYSIDGKEIGAYLPKSTFAPGLQPGMTYHNAHRITVTADRVGVEAYSGNVGNQTEWVELDLNGKLIGKWRLDTRHHFPGVAFTGDDQAYVQYYNRELKSTQVFRLNRATSTWDLVNSPSLALYGADGDKLVFAQWSNAVMYLSWFQQPERTSVLK